MASPDDATPPRSHAGFWLVLVGAILCALIGAGVVLWRWLPVWAPNVVLGISPWMDPAFRAMVATDWFLNPAFADRLKTWGDRATPTLARGLRSDEVRDRRLAAECLVVTGAPSAVPALIAALDDSDDEVRGLAAKALGKCGDRTAVPALVRRLATRQAKREHYAAADAIAALGDPRLLDLVAPSLASPVECERGLACLALAKSNDPRVIAAVAPLLGSSSFVPDNFYDGATFVLGSSRRPEALDAIGEALTADRPARRAAALYAAHRNLHPTLLPRLLPLVDDPAIVVRSALATALASYLPTHPEALATLTLLIDQGGAPAVRAVKRLAYNHSPEVTALFLARLTHPDPAVRIQLVEALSLGANPAVSTALLVLLDDPEPTVRQALFKSLGELSLTPEQLAHAKEVRSRTETGH